MPQAAEGRTMPRSKATKKKRHSVPLTGSQKSALQKIAVENDVSVARVMLQAIKEFLEKHKDRRLPLFRKRPQKG
jgi:hypothetical protein